MIRKAISSLRPKAEWVLRGDTYAGLEWFDTVQSKPTESEVAAEVSRLERLEQSTLYKAQRAAEYPSIGDQLDALFHAGIFPADMAAQIQAVKTKYPKP